MPATEAERHADIFAGGVQVAAGRLDDTVFVKDKRAIKLGELFNCAPHIRIGDDSGLWRVGCDRIQD